VPSSLPPNVQLLSLSLRFLLDLLLPTPAAHSPPVTEGLGQRVQEEA
jgi:hypothetical protein